MQTSLLSPLCGCGWAHEPHYLPNYDPPVWVIGLPPGCGVNIYAPTREEAEAAYWGRFASATKEPSQ